MSFLSADQLNTLADAREAYANLLASHGTTVEELDAVRGDLTAASEMLDEANGRITALTNDLTASREKEQQLGNDLTQAKERQKEADTLIKQLEADAKSAEAKAAEICASVGVDPVQVTPGGDAKQANLLEQFNAITDPAKKTAFFRKHREEILRAN
jgi:chromosome segregation ATPase